MGNSHTTTLPLEPPFRVWDRDALYNNTDDVAASPIKSLAKLAYYHAFALLYGLVGAFAQVCSWWGDGLPGVHVAAGACWSGGRADRSWPVSVPVGPGLHLSSRVPSNQRSPAPPPSRW